MIPAECPGCGASIEAPDETAGQQVVCPECMLVFLMPYEDVRPIILAKSTVRAKPQKPFDYGVLVPIILIGGVALQLAIGIGFMIALALRGE